MVSTTSDYLNQKSISSGDSEMQKGGSDRCRRKKLTRSYSFLYIDLLTTSSTLSSLLTLLLQIVEHNSLLHHSPTSSKTLTSPKNQNQLK